MSDKNRQIVSDVLGEEAAQKLYDQPNAEEPKPGEQDFLKPLRAFAHLFQLRHPDPERLQPGDAVRQQPGLELYDLDRPFVVIEHLAPLRREASDIGTCFFPDIRIGTFNNSGDFITFAMEQWRLEKIEEE